MEELDYWKIRVVEVYVFSVFLSLGLASAIEGFVGVACCANSNYTDLQTTLIYKSDFSWFSDRRSCKNITKPVTNYQGYDRARVFEIDYGKRCYNLTTIKDQEYLLRGTFLFGDSLSSASFFDISIGVTPLSVVNSSDDFEIEGIFQATKDYIDFCLVRRQGDPYISQLELSPVHNYLQDLPSTILKLISRNNLGKEGDDIRYPIDPSDRIWKSTLSPPSSPISSPTATISNDNVNGAPPLQVLQTVLYHPERLEFNHSDLEPKNYEYSVRLYFLEFNVTVRGQRVFDIYANGEIRAPRFDILANGSNYGQAVLNVTANGYLNLTLIKASGSVYGPICSAYEILQVRPWIEETNQTDLEVILKVKQDLLLQNQNSELLEGWYGDPCKLIPWKGLGCDYSNTSPVISKLDLSSSAFKGPLPSNITELTNLKILNLSHNSFNGNISSFPLSSKLMSVDLSYNNFTGLLPDSLTSLPNLTSLYFRCNNQMSKELPSNFNRLLDTDYGKCISKESSRLQQQIVIGTVACGSLLLTLAVGTIFVCCYREKLMPWGRFGGKKHSVAGNLVFSLPSKDDFFIKSVSIQAFTLEYIEAATQKYKTLIGEGGFGSVYRGTLTDGDEVAVKVRSATSSQGTREFDNELNLLSAIRHENLVPLLGYCCENDQQILVYPFMSNGSLQDRLYGKPATRKILDWPTRLSIALGAARGLTYLHTFSGRCVIHRDVKSSNILLDHSMCAKVADFGFSKYAPQEGDSGASLEVRGTAGYMDPEYYTTQQFSAKSDVFSFGVVLLEIVTGREPLNIHRPRKEWSLVEWAKPYIRESKIDEIVDPGIKGGYHAEAMWRVVEVALTCIEPFSAHRPCMADIVRELEDALIIENNASEYMKSIDSLGGSNRFSIVIEKRILTPPSTSPTSSTLEPSPITTQTLSPPQPR